MSQYYVKTENSRGKLVTATQSLFAQATLQTLKKDVTKFDNYTPESTQVNAVRVTLERFKDKINVVVDLRDIDINEEIVVDLIGSRRFNTTINQD
jgi:hypothetical protein